MKVKLIALFGLTLSLMLTSCITGETKTTLQKGVCKEAEVIMKNMSQFLAAKKDLQFKVYGTIESTDGDTVIHNSNTLQFSIKRPNKIHAVLLGDTLDRIAVYDGQQLAILDNNLNACMIKRNVPDTIDEFIDFMAETEGIVVPISDFFTSDVYKSMMANVVASEVIGDGMVRDKLCHHLLFQQENIDWQIWISADKKEPVPMKLVIRYKNLAHSPQYIAMFENWSFSPINDKSLFIFKKPADLEEIEFISDLEIPANSASQ